MNKKPVYILGIESSCDETSAAISCDDQILSNIIAGQSVHERYGGVVPELASRAHQQQIIPVVDAAIAEANIDKNKIDAVAFTRGPGLVGALLVGCSFAKTFALSLNIPLIEVNHMQAHVIGNFAFRKGQEKEVPKFPFLCLTVSGGHTQIVLVKNFLEMEIIGQTRDDAAGEAFDKAAKMLGLPYPGGPEVDKNAAKGNPKAFKFPVPAIDGYDYSFSGFKTAVLYFLQKQKKENEQFIDQHIFDICASIQHSIVEILMQKLERASKETGINEIAIAGGVSANKGLRTALSERSKKFGWNVYIPNFEYCTDNAAMIALYGYHKFLDSQFCGLDVAPLARYTF
jgi:N6-L-threonylcarbamoyladenine synthase